MSGWLEVLVILGAAALVVCVACLLAYLIVGPTDYDIDL